MLTELRCRQAKAAEKSYKLSDARGLHMFVTTTNFRSWRWKYRIADKEKLLVLGSYPEVSLALAREHRDPASRLLKAGTIRASTASKPLRFGISSMQRRSKR